jgi:hypothetical protein
MANGNAARLFGDKLPPRLRVFPEARDPNAIGYAKLRSRSHDAVIRVYDEAGTVIETHEHTAAISKSGERDHVWDFEQNKNPPKR